MLAVVTALSPSLTLIYGDVARCYCVRKERGTRWFGRVRLVVTNLERGGRAIVCSSESVSSVGSVPVVTGRHMEMATIALLGLQAYYVMSKVKAASA